MKTEKYLNHESDTLKTLKELENMFLDHLKSDPDLQNIKSDLTAFVTEDDMDQFTVIEIPLDRLYNFQTACGTENKRPFTEDVIKFLRQRKVKSIFALVNEWLEIWAAVVPIGKKDGRHFQDLVYERGGSLRCDSASLKGWTVYESE